jgi:hypothetical protein
VPLAATLLKAGYIVIVAVPQVKEAEALERRLSGLEGKSALRVLIYDPDDVSWRPLFTVGTQLTGIEQHIPPVPAIAASHAYSPIPRSWKVRFFGPIQPFSYTRTSHPRLHLSIPTQLVSAISTRCAARTPYTPRRGNSGYSETYFDHPLPLLVGRRYSRDLRQSASEQ